MKDLVSILERIAPSNVPILIEGESGTGKDLLARAAHAMSRAPPGPYVALNMSAIPENLAESELFGHEKGAFTGADQARPASSPRRRAGRSSSTRSASCRRRSSRSSCACCRTASTSRSAAASRAGPTSA